jgi:phosphoglycerate dehydrogenase-like enzyme
LHDASLKTNLAAGGPSVALAEADIAFGQPDVRQIIESTRLKWIQLNSAGYTRYDRPDVIEALRRRGAILSNASSVYDEPCAEHLLAFMLAHARRLPEAFGNQMGTRGWPARVIRDGSRLLIGQSVLLVGFGAIARRMVELLTPFRMKLVAVRRSPKGDEPIEVHPTSQVDSLLPAADHVINVLPQADATERFFTANRFGRMKHGAILYNVGRGTTVEQPALIAALRSGQLAAAYLDVTDPEPLPPDHELWQTPNCHITPHSGGGCDAEFDRHVAFFIENFARYLRGEQLRDRVI